jgi:hypothetical protein
MKALKFIVAASMLVAVAAPAFAQDSDTIKLIIAKGNKLAVMGMEFNFVYKADGTYSDAASGMGGKYRIDGKKLCITPEALGQELCSEYPDGKKSGDTFDVQSDFGPLTITIK